MHIARYVVWFFAAFFIAAAALPFIRHPAWWIRMFDFPRVQLMIGSLVAALAVGVVYGMAGALARWLPVALIGLLLGGAAVHAWKIYPYTPLADRQTKGAADSGPTLRVAASNVLMSNRDFTRWQKVVIASDPDVIAAVETDQWWAERLSKLDGYPHVVSVPQDDTYGMMLLSRVPIVSHEVRYLVEETVPSIWAKLDVRGEFEVRVVVLHPRPPRPTLRQGSELRDAELVLAGRKVAEDDGTVIVVGDLNDVAWSYTTSKFQGIAELLDPRQGRGLYSTFHADYAVLRYPLDHLFHSEDLTLVDMGLLEHVGSDHFPLLVSLRLEPSSGQVAPDASPEDVEEAEESVEAAEEKLREESPEERHERREEDQ